MRRLAIVVFPVSSAPISITELDWCQLLSDFLVRADHEGILRIGACAPNLAALGRCRSAFSPTSACRTNLLGLSMA